MSGLDINSITLLGIAENNPNQMGDSVNFNLLTEHYDFVQRQKVQVSVPIIVQNAKDCSIILSTQRGKQFALSGCYVNYDNNGIISGGIVPARIGLGANTKGEFVGASLNDCTFYGKLIGNFEVNNYITLLLEVNSAYKGPKGYPNITLNVPIAIEASDFNKNTFEKYVEEGRGLVIQNAKFYNLKEVSIIGDKQFDHIFITKFFQLGMKNKNG